MKLFEKPSIELVQFDVEDVLSTSPTVDDYVPGENEGGIDWES